MNVFALEKKPKIGAGAAAHAEIAVWLSGFFMCPAVMLRDAQSATVKRLGVIVNMRAMMKMKTKTEHEENQIIETSSLVPKRSLITLLISVAVMYAITTYQSVQDGTKAAQTDWLLLLSLGILSAPFIFAFLITSEVNILTRGKFIFKHLFWKIVKILSILISASSLLFVIFLVLQSQLHAKS
jgi:hypothetical protein